MNVPSKWAVTDSIKAGNTVRTMALPVPASFPADAVIFNAFARSHGPWPDRQTREHHGPASIYPTGHADLNTTTPHAEISKSCIKWHSRFADRFGLDKSILADHHHVDNWEIVAEYDAISDPRVRLHKVFLMRNKREEKNIWLVNPFAGSWYLKPK